MEKPLTIVIPVYNEEAGLTALYERLYPALDQLDRQYEVIFVDDGKIRTLYWPRLKTVWTGASAPPPGTWFRLSPATRRQGSPAYHTAQHFRRC